MIGCNRPQLAPLTRNSWQTSPGFGVLLRSYKDWAKQCLGSCHFVVWAGMCSSLLFCRCHAWPFFFAAARPLLESSSRWPEGPTRVYYSLMFRVSMWGTGVFQCILYLCVLLSPIHSSQTRSSFCLEFSDGCGSRWPRRLKPWTNRTKSDTSRWMDQICTREPFRSAMQDDLPIYRMNPDRLPCQAWIFEASLTSCSPINCGLTVLSLLADGEVQSFSVPFPY